MRPHHINNILISSDQIERRIDELVKEIAQNINSDNLVLGGILRGSFMFIADLVRDFNANQLHPRLDFMTLESYYGGTSSTGEIQISKDLSVNVKDADVLLIDDILDTGRTLTFATNLIREKGARSVRTCVLLNKPSCRVIPIEADFTGFIIEDVFVVGYGLDYESHYRELPHIATVSFTD